MLHEDHGEQLWIISDGHMACQGGGLQGPVSRSIFRRRFCSDHAVVKAT